MPKRKIFLQVALLGRWVLNRCYRCVYIVQVKSVYLLLYLSLFLARSEVWCVPCGHGTGYSPLTLSLYLSHCTLCVCVCARGDLSFFTEFRFIILTHLIFGTVVRRFVNFSSWCFSCRWLSLFFALAKLFPCLLLFSNCSASLARSSIQFIFGFSAFSPSHSAYNSITGLCCALLDIIDIYLTLNDAFFPCGLLLNFRINGLVVVSTLGFCFKNGRRQALKWSHNLSQ